MAAAVDPQRRYVFDAASLIELERDKLLALLSNLGNRVCIPSRVAREVNKRGTGLHTWLLSHAQCVTGFVPGSVEEEIYYDLTADVGPRLGDGESAAIAIAVNRGAILVTDDEAALEVAGAQGVACLRTVDFLNQPLV